ncbi:AraC family transcriptional regulator [Nocardia sp. NPDC058379]|uniref:AraC family transcriptional regulator n=1 Tax=unclassified Nocardia TaxID=2637762 RepID=UPI00364DA260
MVTGSGFRRSMASVVLMTQFGVDRRIPLDRILAGSDLTAADLADSTAQISAEQEMRVAANIARALDGHPQVGLELGRRYRMSTFGSFGFACLSSPTFADAASVFLRYLDLTFTFCIPKVEVTADAVVASLDDSGIPEPVRQFLVERDAAAILTVIEEIFPGRFRPHRVELTTPTPASTQPFEDVLHVRPVFAQQANRIVFDPKLLTEPLPQANPRILAECEALCRELVNTRRQRNGLSAQVQVVLTRLDLTATGQDDVARQLGLSSRTLRRRLREEGTTFHSLRDEVRVTLAEQMLRSGALSVEDIAIRLGYAEAASFTHAFKRWKGVTPTGFQDAEKGWRRATDLA